MIPLIDHRYQIVEELGRGMSAVYRRAHLS
jgi:hypothetical protein